jgi:hypothetical protein
MKLHIETSYPYVDPEKPFVETDQPVAPGAELSDDFFALYSGCSVTERQSTAPSPYSVSVKMPNDLLKP